MNILSFDQPADRLDASTPSGTMALVSAGDQASVQIEQLYGASRAKLRPALAKRLGNQADAEDVLHEAFVRFLARYAGQTLLNPLAMLAQIALNIVRDGARSERLRRNLLALQSEPVCSVASEPDPETALAISQDAKLLSAAIDALPCRCREVFLLHCIDELPHREVARILGISRSMVEKHVMRAYDKLRADLEIAGWAGIDKPKQGKA